MSQPQPTETIPPTLQVNEDDNTQLETAEAVVANGEEGADVFANAEFALNIVGDPATFADRINNAFNDILLYGGEAVYGVELADDDEDEDEEDNESVASSKGSSAGQARGEEPPEDDILDWDKISENESEHSHDDDGDGIGQAGEPVDRDFLAWLNMEDTTVSRAQRRREAAAEDDDNAFVDRSSELQPTAMEADLQRLQLSEKDEYISNGSMPERFMAEAVANNRPNLKNIPLQKEGAFYELHAEAQWILHQLRRPGWVLSRSAIAAAECNKSFEALNQSPLVESIRRVLSLMVDKHLEPAHIAIYYPYDLQPLLDAYYDGSQQTMEDGTARIEAAYSAVTGQRQLPYTEGDYSVFATRPAVSDDVDPHWRNERRREYNQRAIRKPSSLLSGRILWQIFDLDMLCHKLERGRLSLELEMEYNNFFVASAQGILKNLSFNDPVEMLFWAQYTKYCGRRLAELPTERGSTDQRRARADRNWNTRPTLAVEDLSFETYFNDLFLPANVYHERLANPFAGDVEPHQMVTVNAGENLFVWLTRIGAPISKDAPKVLRLLVSAFVEQYSKLPLLRKVIFDTFLEQGTVTVTPVGPVLLDGINGPQSYRITQLIGQNPLLFLRLHQNTQVPAGQTAPINMEFKVSDDALVEALGMNTLFATPAGTDPTLRETFATQRTQSFTEMAQYVASQTIPHVKSALLRSANLMAAQLSASELGKLCAEGPYQPTKLAISPFAAGAKSWDSSWNVAEALPVEGSCIVPGSARVCGVYLADRTSTATFVFCDEFGGVMGTLRWMSCNATTPDGLQTHRRQCVQFLTAVRKYHPNVIAVSMCGERSTALFRILEDVVRDYVWPDLNVNLPVVWTPAASGTVYRHSSTADREMANVEPAVRCATSIARYARDPLMELCRFFDPATKDILQFPLYIAQGSDEALVYTHLEREMSLWVSAVSFDLNTILAQSNPEMVLQFCAGLGKRKASKLISFVTLCGGVASRQPLVEFFQELNTPKVAENFLPTVRVEDKGQKAGEASVHPCDVTMLPVGWYPAADLLVQASYATTNRISYTDINSLNGLCPPSLAWAHILDLSESARWRQLVSIRSQEGLFNNFKALLQQTPFGAIGERHIDLILDEVVAMGHSYQRRPYRLVNNRWLMKQLTNVTFFSRADVLSGATKASDLDLDPRELIVREGDQLECTVEGIQSKPFPSIRVSTSRGLNAVIPITEEEFGNSFLRAEFFAHVAAREEARRDKDSFVHIATPEWLRKGAPIFGIVSSCLYGRCELRLQWTPAPAISEGAERRMRREEEEEHFRLEEGELEDTFMLADTSSAVSSVKSTSLLQHALVYRTKASRHSLFRNVLTNGTLERLLLKTDVNIGELLLRPFPGRTNWITLCIKVGAERVINWPIRESRGRSGNLYYEVPDKRLDKVQNFDSIDHCIYTFVEKLATRINILRQHRRFYLTVDAANAGISQAIQEQREQLVEESRQFAYAFAETAAPSQVAQFTNPSSALSASVFPYCVVYLLGGRPRQSPVHIDNEGLYVKLKTVRSATSQTGYEWFRATDPEALAFIIKNYANQVHKLSAKFANSRPGSNSALPNSQGRGGSSGFGARGISGISGSGAGPRPSASMPILA